MSYRSGGVDPLDIHLYAYVKCIHNSRIAFLIPEEFRWKMVEPKRPGRSPYVLSKEFEPMAVIISRWVKQIHVVKDCEVLG